MTDNKVFLIIIHDGYRIQEGIIMVQGQSKNSPYKSHRVRKNLKKKAQHALN